MFCVAEKIKHNNKNKNFRKICRIESQNMEDSEKIIGLTFNSPPGNRTRVADRDTYRTPILKRTTIIRKQMYILYIKGAQP